VNCRILLVDDDAGNRDVLSRLLQRLGAQTLTFSTGEEILFLMEAGQEADLIILDFHLPGLSGAETAKKLRGLSGCPPLVCLTGDDVEKTSDFDHYLIKPVRLASLQELLTRTCFSQP